MDMAISTFSPGNTRMYICSHFLVCVLKNKSEANRLKELYRQKHLQQDALDKVHVFFISMSFSKEMMSRPKRPISPSGRLTFSPNSRDLHRPLRAERERRRRRTMITVMTMMTTPEKKQKKAAMIVPCSRHRFPPSGPQPRPTR